MYDSVKEHEDRTEGILTGYLVGILLLIAGIALIYFVGGFGIHLIWIGAFIFIVSKLTSKHYKKRYRYH